MAVCGAATRFYKHLINDYVDDFVVAILLPTAMPSD